MALVAIARTCAASRRGVPVAQRGRVQVAEGSETRAAGNLSYCA